MRKVLKFLRVCSEQPLKDAEYRCHSWLLDNHLKDMLGTIFTMEQDFMKKT